LLLGSDTPSIRKDKKENAEPIKTDQNNYIVDAPFPTLLLPRDCAKSLSLHPTHKGMEGKGEGGKWDVETLAREIKLIEGVLSVGLFVGQNGLQAQQAGQKKGGQKPVAVYFGMEDGSVEVRNADGLGQERPVDS
jgi:ribose 5-phosphate isomerase A